MAGNINPNIGLPVTEITDKVNAGLPISVTEDVVKDNPEFSNLLMDLLHHINSDGLPITEENNLEKAKEEYKKVRYTYLQCSTLYSSTKESLEEFNLDRMDRSPRSPDEIRTLENLEERLKLCELRDYLPLDLESQHDVNLLDLNEEFLKTIAPKLTNQMVDLIEKKLDLNMKAATLHLSDDNCDVKGFQTILSQFSSMVEIKKEELNKVYEDIDQEKSKQSKLAKQTQEAIQECFNILHNIIAEHRLKIKSKGDQISAYYMATKTEAFINQLRRLKYQVLCKTYTPDSVSALQKIGKSLIDKKIEIEKEILDMSHSLQGYEAAGSELKAIITEYTKIKAMINNKQWAQKALINS